ncbi:MAG: hypothetical protein K6A80_06250 [Saccharofermentans sp.]|nr:hypothetical protein [Saccharofermentans sp.]
MKKALALLICTALVLAGCSSVEEPTAVTGVSSETSESLETTETTLPQYLEHDYIPEGDGYFSLFDEGYGTRIKAQVGGTCWANACSTSLESNYKITTGEDIFIDPISIVSEVYGRDKEEGFFLAQGVSRLNAGGNGYQVVFAAADGLEGYFLSNADSLDPDDMETIKQSIREHGAVYAGVPDNSSTKGYFDNYITLNDNPDVDPDFEQDHAVVLVGWDDNFPADYFTYPPSSNGAWLAQNSMGGISLYWISYESPLDEVVSFEITDAYSDAASYDCGFFDSVSTGESTSVASVFHHPGTLAAIGVYTASDNETVTVEILDGEFGEILSTVSGTFEHMGFHVLSLPETLDVEDYTIAATFDGDAAIESFGMEDVEWGVSVITASHEGESFIRVNGEWQDMSLEATAEMLGAEGLLNNCCLKGFYVTTQ